LAAASAPEARVRERAGRGWLLSVDTLAAFDAFVALGLLGLYLKMALLAPQWGAVARFLGKRPGELLSFQDRLGFFASDLALNLLVVPVVATLLVGLVFGAYRALAACVIGAGLSVAYFVELRASTEVGRYLSREMLRDFIGWSMTHPSSASEGYVTVASAFKLAVLLGLLAALVPLARAARRTASPQVRHRLRLLLAAPAAAAVVAAAVLAPLAYAVRLPGSPLNTSAVVRAATLLAMPVDDRSTASPWGSVDDALASLRRLTHTAPLDRTHALVGREAGADLVVVVLETGPAQAFDYTQVAARLPGARRLQPHAFVSPRHYTAHPYSSDAIFSLLAGGYPHGRHLLLRDVPDRGLAGLFSGLPPEIGWRGAYLPSLYQNEADDRMYRAFGARTLYVADQHPDDPFRTRALARADAMLRDLGADRLDAATKRRLHDLLVGDLQALERLKADITRTMRDGGRYAVMFVPEVGHAPWPQLRAADTDVLARGRTLMELQDAWLNELVDVIAAAGRLDRTVIAVTADHGLRTRAEYRSLRPGFLSDIMFRVPLLIYAPRALPAPVELPAATSHIDLAPTLLTLLGATDAAARMHGVPVWQRTSRDRLYVLGSAYGGADGFMEAGRFYMHQTLSGAVYASDRFAFTDADQVRPPDPLAAHVVDGLAGVNDGQLAVVARLRAEQTAAKPRP
jgi:hypothetical protein